jgi:hypothetical protein
VIRRVAGAADVTAMNDPPIRKNPIAANLSCPRKTARRIDATPAATAPHATPPNPAMRPAAYDANAIAMSGSGSSDENPAHDVPTPAQTPHRYAARAIVR